MIQVLTLDKTVFRIRKHLFRFVYLKESDFYEVGKLSFVVLVAKLMGHWGHGCGSQQQKGFPEKAGRQAPEALLVLLFIIAGQRCRRPKIKHNTMTHTITLMLAVRTP